MERNVVLEISPRMAKLSGFSLSLVISSRPNSASVLFILMDFFFVFRFGHFRVSI